MGWVCGEGKVKIVPFKSHVLLTFTVVIKGNVFTYNRFENGCLHLGKGVTK